MKPFCLVKLVLVSLAVWGMCVPAWTLAAETAPAPPIIDIGLRDGGVLVGQVVNAQGAPKANVRVSLQDTQNQEIAAPVTDAQGRFAIQGLRGGVYQVVTPVGRGIYRLWAPGTAPPSAQQGLLIVAGDVVRGDPNEGGLRSWLNNPLVIAGVVATAVALPIALSQHHHHPASP